MSHALLQAWEKTLRRRGGDRAVVQATDGQAVTFRELDARAAAWLAAHASTPVTLSGRAVASSLNRYPNSTIEVIGHTDNTASAAYNQDLSQRRASAVANVLIKSGVPGGRVAAYGRGEDQPIASNLSASGRAQNRRVEIIIRPTR